MFVASSSIDYCYVLKSQKQVLLKLLKLFFGGCRSLSMVPSTVGFLETASAGAVWKKILEDHQFV
jgi:hypothetical protein